MRDERYNCRRRRALEFYAKANIILRDEEKDDMEITDFGLDDYDNIGLAVITYVNTERCCAKELVLLPLQTCPEHSHPPVLLLQYEGKEETFRCRYGTVYLYVEGAPQGLVHAEIPKGYKQYFTAVHEVILQEGGQYTLPPDTRHWFQAGPQGAVISEFSTRSLDEYDVFTDANIKRISEY